MHTLLRARAYSNRQWNLTGCRRRDRGSWARAISGAREAGWIGKKKIDQVIKKRKLLLKGTASTRRIRGTTKKRPDTLLSATIDGGPEERSR